MPGNLVNIKVIIADSGNVREDEDDISAEWAGGKPLIQLLNMPTHELAIYECRIIAYDQATLRTPGRSRYLSGMIHCIRFIIPWIFILVMLRYPEIIPAINGEQGVVLETEGIIPVCAIGIPSLANEKFIHHL
jgi:hypothetical protein